MNWEILASFYTWGDSAQHDHFPKSHTVAETKYDLKHSSQGLNFYVTLLIVDGKEKLKMVEQ